LRNKHLLRHVAGALPIYDDIHPELRKECEDVVLNRSSHATEDMLELAEKEKTRKEELKTGGGDASKVKVALEWRSKPVKERQIYALLKGMDEFVCHDDQIDNLRGGHTWISE
jgi:5-methyltetrahydrofolate--homocysteine methyltransferase